MERQKSAKTFTHFLDFNSHLSCNEHTFSSSSVGICPLCLNDRLMKLLCSDCGQRRVSSCSCSKIDSCSSVDAGRMSLLIENDEVGRIQRGFFLRSRSSNCVGADRSSGFGLIKRLFSKRRNKGGRGENLDENSDADDGFSRGGFAGILDFDEDGFGVKEVGRNRSVFPGDLSKIDETGFIELKLDSWYECEQDSWGGRASDDGVGVGCREESFEVAGLRRNGNGGSCRITMNERGLKQGRSRNYKPWKWIFNFS